MLRIVFAAVAVSVLATPVRAGDRDLLVAENYMIGDADAYEDDYSDEFEKATKEEYKARKGEKERLQDKEWEFWQPILDRDPFWSGPLQHENGDVFHHLNTTWPMEAAATLDSLRFYIRLTGNAFGEKFTKNHGDEEVSWHSVTYFGVAEGRIGLPLRIEIGLKYIVGETISRGDNSNYWYVGRAAVIRDDERGFGSKAIELNAKWNIWKHDDGISGFGFNLKYKEPMSKRSAMLDTTQREGGINLIGSLKWGPTSWHANIGYIYTRGTGVLFHAAPETLGDPYPSRIRIRPFFTAGFAGTVQIWQHIMIIGQLEGHTNAWIKDLDDTYNARYIGTMMIGIRGRIGPMVLEGGIGRRMNEEASDLFGVASIALKF